MQKLGNVFMVVAPSGAGKSSLVSALLKKDPSICLSVSCTTREPRNEEINGVHYHFTDVPVFEKYIHDNALLEWAMVHGNYYGTPKHFVLEKLRQGQDVLLEIDWQGASKVRQNFPQIIDVFILPPSLATLKDRLTLRAQDSKEVIERRVKAASGEIAHASECEYVIINDDFDYTLFQLQQIIAVARLRFANQAVAHHNLFTELGITERKS